MVTPPAVPRKRRKRERGTPATIPGPTTILRLGGGGGGGGGGEFFVTLSGQNSEGKT